MSNFSLFFNATLETLYMTVAATLLAYVLGLPTGILLAVTDKNGIKPNRVCYTVVGTIVNILRSVPFLILIVLLIPVTRAVVGTFIGSTATIFPLTVAAAPYVARLVESSLKEVDGGTIEAARSMGASDFRVVTKVMLPEALPSLLVGFSIAITTILGYSAMAGFIGGGGLGNVAQTYGIYRYNTKTMLISVAILVIIVQGLQAIGTFLAKKTDKRKKR